MKSVTNMLPAGFHGVVVCFVNLLETCHDAVLLLTHPFSHFEGQSVATCPLSQKHANNAAAAGIHFKKTDKKINKQMKTL